jgi:hypothetical protein
VHCGVLYKAVKNVAISPTFALDRTLYAFGLGLSDTADSGRPPIYVDRAAIFRSQDAGATWEMSQEFPRANRGGVTVLLAMSPFYATDGMAFYVHWIYPSPSPSSSGCTAWQTADAGVTWRMVRSMTSYETCWGKPVVGGTQGIVLLLMNSTTGPLTTSTYQGAFGSDGADVSLSRHPGAYLSVEAAVTRGGVGSAVFASASHRVRLGLSISDLWVWGP